MVRKGRLDLTNSRLQLPDSVRVVDSLDFMTYQAVQLNDCGAQIPFLSKPPRENGSAYREWKTGKMQGGGSGAAPIVDNHGRYFEVSKAVELAPSPLKISERQDREHDYGSNTTARIYYCQKKRINTPAMNRVLDNTHEVRGATVESRVLEGLVPGGSWETKGRDSSSSSSSGMAMGPGYYDVFAFEAHHGPTRSNLLQFMSAPSGRDVDDESNRAPTKADRVKARRLLSSAGNGGIDGLRDDGTCRPQSSGLLGAVSSLSSVGVPNFGNGGDRWKSPIYRVEKYVKTTGVKLSPDFDAAQRDREKVPILFPTMPQRWEPKVDAKPDVEVDIDCGHKMSIATAAKLSPVKYSMAFRSKDHVGLHLPPTTSPPHLGPGAFPYKTALEVKWPDKPSTAFLAPRTTVFKTTDGTSGDCSDANSTFQQPRLFSETNTQGPVFSKDGTGAGLVLKIKMEKQIKSLYPRLGKKLFYKPKIEIKDPWAHLRPKKK